MRKKFKLKTGWTKQSVYDTIKKRNKGRKCSSVIDGSLSCQYRFKGRACFAGCFITDDNYRFCFEGTTISGLLQNYPALKKDMPFDEDGMKCLQNLHDENTPIKGDLLENLKQWLEDNVEESNVTTTTYSGDPPITLSNFPGK
jgi:hypothetical protein